MLSIPPALAMEAGQIQPVTFLVGVAEREGDMWAAKIISQTQDFIHNFKDVDPLALWLTKLKPAQLKRSAASQRS